MNPLFLVSVALTVFCAVALVTYFILQKPLRDTKRRVSQVTRNELPRGPSRARLASARLLRTFHRLRGSFGASANDKLRARFVAGGMRNNSYVEAYLTARILGPIGGIICGTFIPSNSFLWMVSLAGLAYLGPDMWLQQRVRRRREKIRRSMPDAVDLLVICVDAGLGLDQAMLRVGQELAVSHPEINEEFLQINREQRAGRPRVDAWRAMAERTQLPDVQSFVSMLMQTERFGTPIVRALSSFSDGMRLKRKQVAEEKAAKTTIKMLFPLVLFIFPCVFIVLLGPAVISIAKNLSHLGQ